jgi:hypothetical protein
VPEQPLSSDPQSTFGPNEWLVDELYESYLKDRNSVDKAWWDFFKDYEPGEATYGRDYAVKSNHTPAAATSAQGNGAAPKAAPAAPADPAPAGQPATSAAKPAPAAPAAAPVTTAARVVTNMPSGASRSSRTCAHGHVGAPSRPSCSSTTGSSSTTTWPQPRRQGESFTHIIGFALVKALKAMPEMNYAFGRARRASRRRAPRRVNLGLAIDLAKPDGTRQLLVPVDQGRRTMDFAHFWSAYEDIVKQGARRQAQGGGLPGHHDLADQPGHHRHGALGAPAHAGPGRDHRRRGAWSTRPSGRAPATRPSTATPCPRSSRSPRPMTTGSSRARRAVTSCGRPPVAARCRGVLRRDLREPAHPLRAGALGAGHLGHARRRHQQGRPGPGDSSTPTECAATSWPTPTRWSTNSVATPTSTSPATG